MKALRKWKKSAVKLHQYVNGGGGTWWGTADIKALLSSSNLQRNHKMRKFSERKFVISSNKLYHARSAGKILLRS